MNQNFGVIVWGHDTRLSALAAHPDHEIGFVTTGYDKMVTRSQFHKTLSWQKQDPLSMKKERLHLLTLYPS
jgi:hypothetical protein